MSNLLPALPLFLVCVVLSIALWMEMRNVSKIRERHYDYCAEKSRQHQSELERVRLRSLDEGWENGRQYELTRQSRKRDKAGRFA